MRRALHALNLPWAPKEGALSFHFSFPRYGAQTKERGVKYNIKNESASLI